MEQWPFVARSGQVREIVRLLRGRDRSGVVVAGAAGVGKSRLAFAALSAMPADRWHVAVVRATDAAADIPFGAMAHLLPPGGVPRTANPLGWASDTIAASAGRRSLLLAVDDAHRLDPSSAAVLHQLVHARKAQVLVTIRNGVEAPEPVTALWKHELATRLELGPFDRAEAAEVLAAALGGPVAEETITRLWRMASGNALLLREVVLSAQQGSGFTRRDRIWTLTGDLPLSPRLADVIDERLGHLDAAERDVLEYVAFGEPIGVDLLATLVPAETIEAAEARGLVRVAADERRLQVHLAHPLFGELARLRCPHLRRRRTLGALAAATLATGARRRGDTMRVAVWQLDGGTAADPAALLSGARQAWAAQDYRLAVRLARAAVAAGAGVEASLLLAEVLLTGDEFTEADTVLAAVVEGDYDEQTRTKLVLARAEAIGRGLGRHDEALSMVARLEETVADGVCRQQLTLMRMLIVGTWQAHWTDAAEIGEKILAQPATVMLASEARVQQGWLMVYLGRPVDAIGYAEQALRDRLAWQDEHPHWAGDLAMLLMQASQSIGSMDTFDAAVERGIAEVGHSEVFANMVMVNRGIGKLLRGKVATAVRLLREAELARPVAARGLSGMSELARALAYTGDVAAATEALGEGAARLLMFRKQKVPFGVRLAAPWISAAAGDLTTAREQCRDAIEFFQSEGAVRRELTALHDLVRLGDAATAAPRLAELAGTYQGDLAPLCAEHARAVVASDGPGLDRVGAEFARQGRLLHAAEAYAHAAVAYGEDRPASARTSAARARQLAGECEGVTTPALLTLNAPDLTTREREIAALAAGGLRSSEIAERLHVSVRTVDNHLRIVYAKLGVSGRSGLRAALDPRVG